MAAQGSEWRSWKKVKTRAFLYKLAERLCAYLAYVRCWDQFSAPQNNHKTTSCAVGPRLSKALFNTAMPLGKSQLRLTGGSQLLTASTLLGGPQKQNPRGVRACGRTGTGKIPIVTIKTHFSRQGFCCPGAHSVDRVASHSRDPSC